MTLVDDPCLICGFLIGREGPGQPIRWADVDSMLDRDDGIVWLHLDLSEDRARDWIAASPLLPREAVETLLGADNHMRLEPIGRGLTGVLGDLHRTLGDNSSIGGVLRLYVNDRMLISARRDPLRAIHSLRRAVETSGVRVGRAIDLLVHLLNYLAATVGATIDELADRLDTIEESVLAGEIARESGDLGHVRRVVAELRRHLVPQRQAMAGVIGQLDDWLDASDIGRLRQATERLAAIGLDLDLIQERAHLLQSELASRLAEMTNRNLYFLSIVTAVFLPLTLITGIFGMNVAGLPGLEGPWSFWLVMLGMAVTAVVSFALMRCKRLL